MNPESRLSRLETLQETDKETQDMYYAQLNKRLDNLEATLGDLKREVTQYKGFVGGVSLAISLAWAGVAMFKEQLIKLFSH